MSLHYLVKYECQKTAQTSCYIPRPYTAYTAIHQSVFSKITEKVMGGFLKNISSDCTESGNGHITRSAVLAATAPNVHQLKKFF